MSTFAAMVPPLFACHFTACFTVSQLLLLLLFHRHAGLLRNGGGSTL
jgi:hypothetical protein